MNALSKHLILSIIFISFYYLEANCWLVPFFKPARVPSIVLTMEKKISYLNDESKAFTMALVFGNKSRISKEIKNHIKGLGLAHAITPSGMHLSLFHPLINLIPSLPVIILTYLILFLFTFEMDFYFALTRCALFYFLKTSFRWVKFPIKNEWIFYITFFIDFCLGSYFKSPLSFVYSFIFWGVVLHTKNESKMKRMLLLFLCFSLVNLFQTKETSLLYFLFNPILSLQMTLSFFLLCFLLLIKFKWLIEFICAWNIKALEIANDINMIFPFQESLIVLILLTGVIYIRKKRLFLLLLILYSGSLNFEKKEKYNLHTKKIYRAL